MQLDASTEAFLKSLKEQGGPAFHELPVEKCRAAFKEACVGLSGEQIALPKVEDMEVTASNGTLKVRLYYPSETTSLPVVMYFHGGGWVIGDLDTHDNMCRRIAKSSNAIVAAVDYRLAPENKFPAGIEDCISATEWFANNANSIGGDASRLAVAGDSAGGNMAAVVAQELMNKIKYQVLIYPAVDLGDTSYPSRDKYGSGEYFLSMEDMAFFGGHLLDNPEQVLDTKASPITSSNLSGLAPAFTITAGFDPLCDEGKAYHEKLSDAGVKSEYECVEGTIHGFTLFPVALESAIPALELIGKKLKDNL